MKKQTKRGTSSPGGHLNSPLKTNIYTPSSNMNTANELFTTTEILNEIKRLAKDPIETSYANTQLFRLLKALTDDEKKDVVALYKLGQGAGVRSFNVAKKAADAMSMEHIPGMLAEKANLSECLSKGMKRYKKQS